ncbi:ABC transporter B family member 1-like protein, partial [Trifolium pratense]
MSKESEEIKTSGEQWKWSEMQGLELVNDDNNSDPFKGNLPTVIEEGVSQNQVQVSKEMVETSEAKKEEKVVKSVPAVGFGELFRFADGLDYILMTIGTVGAIVHGCSLPIFLRFFADLVNSFGSNANNLDKMTQEVVKYAFYFLVVGAAIWASSWAEISCWMWTGERQSTKMRIKYLEAALKQDIEFFDTEVRTSDVVAAINTDAVMVQDAISEK